jgi:hypothetical protein
MIKIIRAHNRLNGLRFSTVEFGLVGLVVLAMAAYFLVAGAFLNAVVAIGIAVNCVPVVWLGIGSLRAGESDIGLRAMLRPAARAAALREHPTMQRDTYILAGATLLPFVVAVAVVVELRRKPMR